MVAPSPASKNGLPARPLAAPVGSALRDNASLASLLARCPVPQDAPDLTSPIHE